MDVGQGDFFLLGSCRKRTQTTECKRKEWNEDSKHAQPKTVSDFS